MSTARIRFSADILRRLGEELNAYDANATWCRTVSQTAHKAGAALRTAIRDLPSAARRPLAAAFDQYERSRNREAETLRKRCSSTAR